MELTDKQIKDLVARRHPEYEKKKEVSDAEKKPLLRGLGSFIVPPSALLIIPREL